MCAGILGVLAAPKAKSVSQSQLVSHDEATITASRKKELMLDRKSARDDAPFEEAIEIFNCFDQIVHNI